MKKLVTLVLALCLFAFAFNAMAAGKVMLYSSMQEAQLQAVKDAFEAKYPDVTMDYYFASGGKVITKMSTEAQAGQIEADLVWLGDPSDYEGFKNAGYLQQYTSAELDHIAPDYVDADGYYTAARLVTMGIAWCSLDGIGITAEEAPKTWKELLDPKWKDQIIMTDPAQSSPSKYWMAAMMQNEEYGPAYFEALRDNGLQLESGTTATHNVVAAGSYQVGICLDYVSANLMAEGSPLDFHYTTEDVVTMTSPVGIIANCANPDNAKLLYDFIISKEGQEVLVANNLVTVRDDVEMAIDTSAIAAVNMKVDFDDLAENTDNYLAKFNEIFNK
ncbi:MAG: ABC transporter substrate-binding protein [Clostridiales bacterium]|nr:ABC transporter substrate-binding protein [Clostridiales bacterium]